MRIIIEGPEPELVDFEEILDNLSGHRVNEYFILGLYCLICYYKKIIN